ncbi:hypothetical protein [Lentzea sp. NBRC 102530]|uniref:hypothetical protein n=1 Tax=Lentzea sp. NBRC 102530 TaxID=3032201 RepID=UPI0024A229B2|nr:hypothetical protein [Lentzea sp. NBRC 102530]GLY55208.1 hypothetical protein Lesp01_88630 [Lentzea sp. NBRC 102530]
MPDDEVPRDWRGTPVVEGATVIYGASVGRSVAMVQGIVSGFTPSGRVWVDVVHRAYGARERTPSVHVGADRLTVVTELPPTELPTEAELAEQERARREAYHREQLAELGDDAPPELVAYHQSRVEAFSL